MDVRARETARLTELKQVDWIALKTPNFQTERYRSAVTGMSVWRASRGTKGGSRSVLTGTSLTPAGPA